MSSPPLFAGRSMSRGPVVGRYRIDGNLIPPIDEDHALSQDVAAQVRSSGLSAIKLTVGGSGNEDKQKTLETLRIFERSLALNPDLFLKVGSIDDISAAATSGRLGVIFSFEAAEMLEGELENIDFFRGLGVLVMGLSYNVQTPFASGVNAPESTGLTRLGREAVMRMNALGITVDLSHSDDRSGMDAIGMSTRPILISHAGCAAVHQHPRNKSDRLLRALAEKGGVVGIYELSFLVPYPRQPALEDYLAHLTHALNVCGEDHVAIGTDGYIVPFDTSADSLTMWAQENERRRKAGVAAPGEGPLPFVIGLNGPHRYDIIAAALRRRGYPRRVVEKVMGANLLRVFDETWRASVSGT